MQSMKILEGDGVLLSQPLLIEQFGRAGAQFLSQLHYWLNHSEKVGVSSDGIRWIYNSAKDWAEQLCLSSRTVQRLISSLNEFGVLEVKKLSANKHNRTNHYTINYEILEKLINQNEKVVKIPENLITTKCRNGLRQSGVMYIQRLPNKEINKSEVFVKNVEDVVTEHTNKKSCEQVNPVERVKTLKNLSEKSREGYKQSVLSLIEHSKRKHSDSNRVKNDTIPAQNSNVSVREVLPKTNTAQAMLKIWHDAFGSGEKMSKELAPLLVAAYSSKFSKNLEQWQIYVNQIKSSAYLTSEKFTLSITWALKFSIIDRIRAGEFGVKKEIPETEQGRVVRTFEEVSLEITRIKGESAKALELRQKILEAIGVNEYLAWFHQAKFLDNSDGEVCLDAHNAFAETIWKQKYDWIMAA